MVDLVVLDVNETLFPLDPIASRMAEVGLEGQLELWFTRILRDGLDGLVAEVHDVSEVGRWSRYPTRTATSRRSTAYPRGARP